VAARAVAEAVLPDRLEAAAVEEVQNCSNSPPGPAGRPHSSQTGQDRGQGAVQTADHDIASPKRGVLRQDA